MSRFAAGEVVAGRYRIESFLGEGGTGQVFAALDLALGHRIALKALRPDRPIERATPLLIREASAARRINHPGVCRIFDVCCHDTEAGPLLLLTMELLEGETLWQWVRRRGPMPRREAWAWARRIGEALSAAHAQGVVHRDLKSSNLIIVPERGGERIVITDFGLASLVEAAWAGGRQPAGGTEPYAAPEQFKETPPTPALDIHAFAVVLCEMLLGGLPTGLDFDAALAATLPRRRWARRWRALIARSLARNPVERPPTIESMLEGLEPSRTAASDAGRRLPAPIGMAAIAGIFAVLLLPSAGGPGQRTGDGRPDAVMAMGERSLERLQVAATGTSPARMRAATSYIEGQRLADGIDLAAARRRLEHAVLEDPAFAGAHVALAEVLSEMGSTAPARASASRALAIIGEATDAEGLEIESRAARLTGDLSRAARASRALCVLHPRETRHALDLAAIEMLVGDLDAAATRLATIPREQIEPGLRPQRDLTEARLAARRGEPEQQRRVAIRGEEAAIATGDRGRRAEALLEQAAAEVRLGMLAAAARSAEAAQPLFEAFGHRSGSARTLTTLGRIEWFRGRPDRATDLFGRAMSLCRETGDDVNAVAILSCLSLVEMNLGDSAAARRDSTEALALARRLGDRRIIASALNNLANVVVGRGEYRIARELYAESAAISDDLGNLEGTMSTLTNLGALDRQVGDPASSAERFRRAHAISLQLGQPFGVAIARINLAGTRMDQWELNEAATELRLALESTRAAGLPRLEADVIMEQGRLEFLRGDYDAARNSYLKARDMKRRLGDKTGESSALIGLARVALEEGRAGEARTLAGEAAAIARGAGAPTDAERARLWEGRAALRAGSIKMARRAIESATLDPIVEDEEIALLGALAQGELLTAEQRRDEGGCSLADVAERAAATGFREIEVEARASWIAAGMACRRPQSVSRTCALDAQAHRSQVAWAERRLADAPLDCDTWVAKAPQASPTEMM